MFTTREYKHGRVLDFDIENRPLSYWYGDATTAEVTAIAWAFYDEDDVTVATLDPPPYELVSLDTMLIAFREAYDQADLVTGHFIRMHDLPLLSGAFMERGMEPLGSKMTSDTKLDLIRRSDIGVSQENLAAMMGVEAPKVQMTQEDWREANRLSPVGIKKTIHRVHGDVIQHMEMRRELLRRGLLAPPRLWKP